MVCIPASNLALHSIFVMSSTVKKKKKKVENVLWEPYVRCF